MIREEKLKILSAKNTNVRLSKEYSLFEKQYTYCLFDTIDESLDYLKHIIWNISLNPDDLFFSSFGDKNKILFVNILDAAICSITKLSYNLLCKEKKDNDTIAYYRMNLDNFVSYLNNLQNNIKNKSLNLICNALSHTLSLASMILNPTKYYAEAEFGNLALSYYNLMYTAYTQLSSGREKMYLKKNAEIYCRYIMASFKQHTPMGTIDYFKKGEVHNG